MRRYHLFCTPMVLLCLLICSCIPLYSIKKITVTNKIPKGRITTDDVVTTSMIDPLKDEDIIIFVGLENQNRIYNLEMKLYKPDKGLFHETSKLMRQNRLDGWRYTYFSEKSLNLSRYPGEWTAEIYINDNLAWTENFKVIWQPELIEEYTIFHNIFRYFKAGILIGDPNVSDALHQLRSKWDKDYGTVVEGLFENYPAEKGGLKKADIILRINGIQVTDVKKCVELVMYSTTPNKTEFYIYRPKEDQYLTVYLDLKPIEGDDIFTFPAPIHDFYEYRNSKEKFIANFKGYINNENEVKSKTAVVPESVEVKKSAAMIEKRNLSVDFGTYNALVIGINNYEFLPKLKTAINDAKAVKRSLENLYEFKVSLLLDPDRSGILSAFDNLRGRLTSNDNLLVYYAGHGYYDKEAERGYWLPVDAKDDKTANWVSNADITDKLKTIKAKHILIVADSCYSGTLTRGISIKLKSSDYLKKISKKKARIVLTSGGMEPVSDSGGGDHSVFCKAFLNALNENTDIIDGTELFSKIRRPVMLNAPQTPQYSDIRFAGHEGGDFILVRKK